MERNERKARGVGIGGKGKGRRGRGEGRGREDKALRRNVKDGGLFPEGGVKLRPLRLFLKGEDALCLRTSRLMM